MVCFFENVGRWMEMIKGENKGMLLVILVDGVGLRKGCGLMGMGGLVYGGV